MIAKGHAMKIGRCVIRLLCLLGLWTGLALQAHAQTDTVYLYYTDPQGTPLVKTDAQGNVLARYDYTPYGNAVASLGNPPDGPGYTGHVNDPETGLVYMQARYYQPIGRFLSPDPVGPAAGNIYSFNRYAYTNDDPIDHVDPDGRCVDGMNCAQQWEWHVKWRMSHPNAPADGLEKAAFVGMGVMASPAVGVVGYAALRSPLTYLAFSFTTKDVTFDVVEAMKAAQERQRTAEIVEAAKADSKSIEQLIEKLLKSEEKKTVPPPPPPKLPESPSPPKSPAVTPVVHPETHSNNEAVILGGEFSHDG